jgi:hypothetical protein
MYVHHFSNDLVHGEFNKLILQELIVDRISLVEAGSYTYISLLKYIFSNVIN